MPLLCMFSRSILHTFCLLLFSVPAQIRVSGPEPGALHVSGGSRRDCDLLSFVVLQASARSMNSFCTPSEGFRHPRLYCSLCAYLVMFHVKVVLQLAAVAVVVPGILSCAPAAPDRESA